MKFLIVVSCVFAAASAGIVAPLGAVSSQFHTQDELGQYSYGYSGGPSAKHETRTADGITRGGYSYIDAHGIVQSVDYVADPVNGFRTAATNLPVGPAPLVAHAAPVVAAPVHIPAIAANGVPLETPEVVAAKAAHFAAHAEAKARVGLHPFIHYRKRRGLFYGAQHLPIITDKGVPLETPEVMAAKAHHFAAHVEAKARNGDIAVAAPVIAHAAPVLAPWSYAAQHLPIITDKGVPLETPEVVAAKAHHFAAHAEAKVRNGDLAVVAPVAHWGYAAPWSYAAPLLTDKGVPLDAPDVAVAKAAHFAAHAEARARNGDLPLVHHGVIAAPGVPLDTPEVAIAKAEHFAAHAKARGLIH